MAQQAFLLDIQAARNSGIWPIAVADPPRRRLIQEPPATDRIHIEYHGTIPEELLRGVASERAVVLLGDTLDPESEISRLAFASAVSKAAGLGDESDLLRAGYRIEKERGREALVQMALQALSLQGSGVPPAYENLAALPIQTIISFHPDPILERVLLALRPPFRTLLDDSDLADLPLGHSSRELYLLGGSAISGKGLVLTFDDQDRLLLRMKLLARGLRARLASGTILMLGCDLNESNLNELYLEATRHLRRPRTIYLSGSQVPRRSKLPIRVVSMSPPILLETLQRVLPAPAPSADVLTDPQTMRRPYKYLDYFEAEDQDFFFGREDENKLLSAEVMASRNRITVLYGCSGVGKTSLVKAALTPHLERTHHIQTSYTRCGSNPEASIALALGGSGALSENIRATLAALDSGIPTERIVIVDQTEEALIKLGDPVLRNFFAKVEAVLADPELALRFLFIIREDYLGRLAAFQREFPSLLSSVFQLKGLTRDAARSAIVNPAVNCGLVMDEEVVEEILDDLSPDLIVPAHLQIICDQLYERCRERGAITLEEYSSLGRASAILRNHLENAMRQLPEGLEQTARKILRALVTSEHTKDQLSLAVVVGREALSPEEAEGAMRELIHVHRLVREISGDPVRYELSHESLAASVAGWLDARESKERAVQEILDREVINIQTFDAYRIPRDRLRLINEYRQELHLEVEAICVICSELYLIEDVSDFWRKRLRSLSVDRQYEVLWRVLRKSEQESLLYILKEEQPLFALLPESEFPAGVAKPLAKLVSADSSDVLASGIKLASLDTTRKCEESVLRELQNVPDAQAEKILQLWRDTVVRRRSSKLTTNNQFVALAQLLVAALDLPDATQQIRCACSEPLSGVLCGRKLLKAIHGSLQEYRDSLAEAIRCIPPGGGEIEKLAFLWLADSAELLPKARLKMEGLFLRLIDQQSDVAPTRMRTSEFTILLLVLIRCLSGLRKFDGAAGDRYIRFLQWVQDLPKSVRKDEPTLVEEAVAEIVRVVLLDESCRLEETLISGLSKLEDDQAERFVRVWIAWLPEEPLTYSHHGSQVLSLAHILARIVSPTVLCRRLKVLSSSASLRNLAHSTVGEGLDSQAGLNLLQRRHLIRSITELPIAEGPVEELARRWLLSQFDTSPETMAALEEVALRVIEIPDLLETLSQFEYTAILQAISRYLREFETWSLLPPGRAAHLAAALQVKRSDLSEQQEYLIGNLLARYPDAHATTRLIRSGSRSTRAGIVDYLATLDSADVSVVSEIERKIEASDIKNKLTLARALCRWGRPAGLLTAIDVLKQKGLSNDLRLVCAECFKLSAPSARRLVVDERLGSNSSKSKLVDALLTLPDVKWLLDDKYVLDWLLSLNLKEGRLTRLRELLGRLMPELGPRLGAIAQSGNSHLRYSARLILREYDRERPNGD
jgi:hypothetical protein